MSEFRDHVEYVMSGPFSVDATPRHPNSRHSHDGLFGMPVMRSEASMPYVCEWPLIPCHSAAVWAWYGPCAFLHGHIHPICDWHAIEHSIKIRALASQGMIVRCHVCGESGTSFRYTRIDGLKGFGGNNNAAGDSEGDCPMGGEAGDA